MPHEKPWLDEDPIIKHKREIELQAKHDRLLIGAINAMMEARLANDCNRNDCRSCQNEKLCLMAAREYYKLLDQEQKQEYMHIMTRETKEVRKPLTPEELAEKVRKDRIEMGISDKKAKNKNKSPETKGLF